MLAAATNARDRAILAVVFGSGIRVSELVALDVDDVLEDVQPSAFQRGKALRRANAPLLASPVGLS